MIKGRSQGKNISKAIQGHDGLKILQRGIEKESLRVIDSGRLSNQPHPAALGSALTHPNITTDFSEAQLELITGVHNSATSCLQELGEIHQFVQRNINNELLWAASMPCMIGPEDHIPIGQYGTSNIGKAKSIYRTGLSFRYGALMQTISGIHYNFSIPDSLWPAIGAGQETIDTTELRTKSYLDLIRNFRRNSWLLIYLFGASPAVCDSFIRDQPHDLQSFDEGTSFLPFATSLRMGRMGYQSDAQSSLYVSYNSLQDYAKTISHALTEPYPPYAAYGVVVDGQYRQLNTALLQIENEFYGTIRPKPRSHRGQRPLESLVRNGIDYVEVRCLDLNPFMGVGIDISTMHFLDAFLLGCLITPSARDNRMESETILRNQLKVVEEGRKPGLQLERERQSISMTDWALEMLENLEPITEMLDEVHGNATYSSSLEIQRQKIINSSLTPSGQIIETMQTKQQPFFQFALHQSVTHKNYFTSVPLREETHKNFDALRKQSLQDQESQEVEDTDSFEEFLSGYLNLNLEES